MPGLTFQSEKLTHLADEIRPLIELHWCENADNRDKVPLEPDWDGYRRLEDRGALEFLAVRSKGKLVGYYSSFVLCHPHYRTTLFSFVDMYYLLPEYRNAANGIRIFDEYEKEMRVRMLAEGRKKMVLIGRARLKHNAGPLLERLGWKPVEMAYSKLIEA